MTIGELIKHLETYDPATPCASYLWLPEDVQQQAEWEHKTLTDEQVADVLEKIEHYKDATIGITWDTISIYLEDYPAESEAA